MSEEDYSIPIDRLYAIVELKVAGEVYATPSSTSWLKNVKRLISTEGKVSYIGHCIWPKDEDKLNSALEKRSKPCGLGSVQRRPHSEVLYLGRAKVSMERALNASDFSESDNNTSATKSARVAVPRFDPSAGTSRKSHKRNSKARKNSSDADSEDSNDDRPLLKNLSICEKSNDSPFFKSNGSSLSSSDKHVPSGISNQSKISENINQDKSKGSSHASTSDVFKLPGTSVNTPTAGKSGADTQLLNHNQTVSHNRDESVGSQTSALILKKQKPCGKSQLGKITSENCDSDQGKTQDNCKRRQKSSAAGCSKSLFLESHSGLTSSSEDEDEGEGNVSTIVISDNELRNKESEENQIRRAAFGSSDSEDSDEAGGDSGQGNLMSVTSGGSSQNTSFSEVNDNNSQKKDAGEAHGNDTRSKPRNSAPEKAESLSPTFSPDVAAMSTPNGAGHSGVTTKKRPCKTRPASFSPRTNLFGRQPAGEMLTYKSFMREVVDLRRRLDLLKITTNKIYNSVCPVLEMSQNTEDGRGMPSLPVNSFQDLKMWEQYLKDHDNEVHAVRLLAEVGSSSSVKEAVYGMMQWIMTNKVASSMNVKGKNRKNCTVKKAKFQDSPSYVILLSAVKFKKEVCDKEKRSFEFTVSLVDAALGKWLKDAPKRYLHDLKTQKLLPEDASFVPDHM